MTIKTLLKNTLPASLLKLLQQLRSALLYDHSVRSYSQEGEDMILHRLFEGVKTGFYIDVGAHHPKRFSNTYFFYRKGWCGINIDATPGSMFPFQLTRPRDINVEAAIAKDRRLMTFYIFDESALNSFDETLSRSRIGATFKMVGERKVHARPLAEVLSQSIPDGQEISFMNVDVEGLDLEVLESNDWQRFRPAYVLVELPVLSITEALNTETCRFLHQHGYELLAKTVSTAVFRDRLRK